MTIDNSKPKKGSRILRLPESINKEFDDIKNFGNFKQYFGHNFFHSFYSMGIALAINDAEFIEKLDELNKDYEFNPKNEKMINSIDSPQLEHHDLFFKIIAYWVLMKQKDSGCFRVITDTNLARKICEEIFIRYWPSYYDYLLKIGTKFPNIYLINLNKGIIFSNKKK